MHALIIASHPQPRSLCISVATAIADGVRQSSLMHSAEVADLAAENFDPRFTASDIDVHLSRGRATPDVVAEQQRVDRADALALVYPVYWWSMPALLKGWIDRVFVNGWAYDEAADRPSVKKLTHLRVHLVAIGGADLRTYARHGYFGAMRTQIDHGIFGYCGATVVSSELLVAAGSPNLAAEHLQTAKSIGARLFQSDAADAA